MQIDYIDFLFRVTKSVYDHMIIQLAEYVRELAVVIDHLNHIFMQINIQ